MSFLSNFLVGLCLLMNLISIDAAQQEAAQEKTIQRYCCYDPQDSLIKTLQGYALHNEQFDLHFHHSLPSYTKVDFLVYSPMYRDEFKRYKLEHHLSQEDNTIETTCDFQKSFACTEMGKISATKIQSAWRRSFARKKVFVNFDKRDALIMNQANLACTKICIEQEIVKIDQSLLDLQQGCKKDKIRSIIVPANKICRLTESEKESAGFTSMPAFYSIADRKKISISFNSKELLEEYLCDFYDYKSQDQKQQQRDFLSLVATRTIKAGSAIVLQARWRGNKDRQAFANISEKEFLFVHKMRQINKDRETIKIADGYKKRITDLKKCLHEIAIEKHKLAHSIHLLNNLKKSKINKIYSCLDCSAAKNNLHLAEDLSLKKYDAHFIKFLESAIKENKVIEIEDSERLKANTFICCPGCILIAYKNQKNVLPRREFFIEFALGELVKTRREEKKALEKILFSQSK